jgi:hypothetical protein
MARSCASLLHRRRSGRSNAIADDQPDLGDDYFRPFFRALRNLVITFALAEAKSLYEDIASRR